ncbi:MAG: stimulus-sensing domain-containing protein [Rhodospirillales bacterium]|nr:stimulus-sensing domain-containing protein [Rhodospirillales bacterium]MCB9997121.1 stimulus-sensing domain-containing protein [Rhodospirillales bacterium]
MVSDTNTKKNNDRKDAPPRSSKGGLTLRILSVNVLPLLVLVVGLLSLGRYQENLINENLKTLQERAQNFAIAIEGPEDRSALIPDQARRTIRKLSEKRSDNHIRLFDSQGRLIGDSRKLTGPGGVIQIAPLEAPRDDFGISAIIAYLGTEMLELLPTKTVLPPFPDSEEDKPETYPDVKKALGGMVSATAWRGGSNRVILTAAAPLVKNSRVVGVILLTNNGGDIETGMDRVRFDVLTATLAALSITIFLSIYLAGIIGRPLKKLAVAAEKVRQSKDRGVTIPDLSHRRDEIGELSMALRHMTQALWDRMDTIERFAADVAHEIKNPLTSLRSAVETAAKVKDKKDRDRLMEIIQHDVQRLDRLISDISNASRLDAELSRDEISLVDIPNLLQNLVDAHKNPLERSSGKDKGSSPIQLDIPRGKIITVRGNEGRLAQVFENLIGNALSFSPPDGIVAIRILPGKKQIVIEVEDQGPGIPENKLEDIFERFYSERPKAEAYGSHSGLGLSIAKQIITSHGGEIYAENIKEGGKITGACFTVILDRAA